MEVMKQVMGSLGSTEARKNREYFVPGQYWFKINEVKTGRAGRRRIGGRVATRLVSTTTYQQDAGTA